MLLSSFPSVAAVAHRRSTGWTAPDFLQPSSSYAPPMRTRFLACRRCCCTEIPSASTDVGSDTGGRDSRTGHELRLQLSRLQEEAEFTRSKANSARMRLMRLSEAAEQLQKQAASKVKAGKEDDARELLMQKKKIMLTLEKSKNRIELMDKLSAKLNEAILLKETELIGSVSSQSPSLEKDANTPVRVVPGKTIHNIESHEREGCESIAVDNKEAMGSEDVQLKDSFQNVDSLIEEKPDADIVNTNMDIILGITTYKGLLEHVDGQLEGLQDDIAAFLRLSSLGTEQVLRPKSKHLEEMHGILQDVSSIRKRIARIDGMPTGRHEMS